MKLNIAYLLIIVIILTGCNSKKKDFHTNDESVTIKVNGEIKTTNWRLSPQLNPDVFELECKEKESIVTFLDSKDSISHLVNIGDEIDFNIILNQKDTARTRIIGVKPNVNFTDKYIKENKGKVNVAIPEVSELANILIALHKDAEKDKNMTNSNTEYFKRVKKYFKPYLKHPIIDTIQKHINTLKYNESFKDSLFSQESYNYYFALKMNACSYYFDENEKIVNNGIIAQMAKGWNSVDPMKNVDLMTDFAKKSNFRIFYKENKPYYDSLLAIYKKLNPVDKMQEWLDKKFDFTYGNYSIYFSPLVYGAHSTQNFSDDNFKQTFMFICPAEYDDKYSKVINELLESRVIFTEIDHNYVNPISYKYLERINQVFKNRETWAQGEITNNYETPYKVFNEYMTFAVYSLYLTDNYTEEEVLEFLPYMENQMENSRGFINFSSFNRELLQKYKENKNIPIEELYKHMFDWSSKLK